MARNKDLSVRAKQGRERPNREESVKFFCSDVKYGDIIGYSRG
jgi:hypothetical protein